MNSAKVIFASFLLVAIALVAAAQSQKAYNVSVHLGGKDFSKVEGKLKLTIIGSNFRYPVTLSPKSEELKKNTVKNYLFVAPYQIHQVDEVTVSWSGKYYFRSPKIYVAKVVLDPIYMGIYSKNARKTMCPKKGYDGITEKKEAILKPSYC